MSEEQARRRDRGQQQQARANIELRCQPPQAAAGEFSVEVEAIATEGPRALSGRNLQFFVSSAAFSSPERTDDNGRCRKTITGPIPTSREVRIEVQIVGQATRRDITVKIPADPAAPGRTDKRTVSYTMRDDGVYRVSVVVADDKGKPKKGIPTIFVANGEVVTILTDENGLAVHTAKPGKITVVVPGFDEFETDLDHPSKLKPPEPPPPPEDLAGFWNAVWRGWRDGGKARKGGHP